MNSLTIIPLATTISYEDYTPSCDTYTLIIDTTQTNRYRCLSGADYVALIFVGFILIAMISAFIKQPWLLHAGIIVVVLLALGGFLRVCNYQ
jgi:hypothetical protein